MRVLVTASTFPLRQDDGTPRFVLDLCQALTRRCEVTVLAPDAPGASARERWGDVAIERFRYFVPRRLQRLAYGDGMPDNLKRSNLAKLQAPAFVLAQAAATRRLARERRIDLVNSHWLLPQGFAAAIARGRRPRFRHVATLHGGDSYLLRSLPAGGVIARYVASRCDAIVAVSHNVRDNLDATLGRASDAVLQPVGVHVARFRDASAGAAPLYPEFPQGFLVFVGRMIPIKGLEVLLRALPHVREQQPGVGLVAIGYGPLAAELERLAQELGIAAAVRFTGALPHADVAAHLRACRVAVVPSIVDRDGREEGMPTVIGEALAAGARVVASESGGVPDTIRAGVNGWLARPGDPRDLAHKLVEALALPPGSALDRAAEATADGLDWERVADAYHALFENALSR